MKYFLCAALAVVSASAAIPLAAQQTASTTSTSIKKDVTQKLYLVKTDSIKKYAILQHGKESPRAVAVGDTIAGYHLKEVGRDMVVLIGRDSKRLILKLSASSSSVDGGAQSPAINIIPAKTEAEYKAGFYELINKPGITDKEIVDQATILMSQLPDINSKPEFYINKDAVLVMFQDGKFHYRVHTNGHVNDPVRDSFPNP